MKRPEKRKTIHDENSICYKSYPYCPSCGSSENFCHCPGFNECWDQYTEWILGELERLNKAGNKWDKAEISTANIEMFCEDMVGLFNDIDNLIKRIKDDE